MRTPLIEVIGEKSVRSIFILVIIDETKHNYNPGKGQSKGKVSQILMTEQLQISTILFHCLTWEVAYLSILVLPVFFKKGYVYGSK